MTRAGVVGSAPYQPYTGEMVAPINPQQTAGIGGINQYANAAQPYIQAGAANIASAVPAANYGAINAINSATGAGYGANTAAGAGAYGATQYAGNAGFGANSAAAAGAYGAGASGYGANLAAGLGGLTALGYAGNAVNAAQPIGSQQIGSYLNPYTQQVVNATQAQFNNANAQQQQGVLSNAASQGALGGDRSAVAQAILAGQQQLAQAPVIAGLYSQGYNTATQTALAEQQAQTAANMQAAQVGLGAGQLGATTSLGAGQLALGAGGLGANTALGAGQLGVSSSLGAGQLAANTALGAGSLGANTSLGAGSLAANTALGAGYGLANTGTAAQTAGLQGATAQIGAGSLQQQTQQAADTAAQQQYLAAQAYPYQQTQWLAGIDTGVGSQMGGTSTTATQSQGSQTAPAPSFLGQMIGGGLAAAAFLNNRGGRIPGFASGGDVPHFDLGGTAGGFGGQPYAGGYSYIPSGANIQAGKGAPAPITAPSLQFGKPPADDSSKMFNDAASLAKSLKGSSLFSQSYGPTDPITGGYSPEAGIGAIGGDNGPIDIAPGFGSIGAGAVYRRGGHVPTIAGFGTGGIILPRNYADGGDTFDDRWNAFGAQSSAEPSAVWDQAPPTPSDVEPSAVWGKSYNPSDIEPSAVWDQHSLNDRMADLDRPSLSAAIGPGGMPDTSVAGVAPLPTPRPPQADIDAATQPAPAYPVTQGGLGGIQYSAAAPDTTSRSQGDAYQIADRYLKPRIASVESGGEQDPYSATTVAPKNGRTMLGKYQVDEANVPTWTKEALGHSITPQQFLASPEAQEKVATAKLGQYVNKYGIEGATRAWFAGEGNMNNPRASDGFNTVAQYQSKVLGSDSGALPPSATLAEYKKPGVAGGSPMQIAPTQEPQPERKGLLAGLGIDMSPALRQGLMAAGLGMMASPSHFVGQAIGQGGLTGLQAYQQERMREATMPKIQAETENLQAEAKLRQQQLKNLTEQGGPPVTPYQKQELEIRKQQADAMTEYRKALGERANYRPTGAMTKDFHPVLADTHSGMRIDGITGEPIEYGTEVIPSGRGAAGASGGVWKVKHDAWLSAHPGDEPGALDYAAGHRQMNAADLNKAAINMAQRDVAGDMSLIGKNAQQRGEIIKQRAADYSRLIQQGFTPSAAAAQPAAAAASPAAAPLAQGQKPTIVRQNGWLYELQPDGSYKPTKPIQ